MYSSYLQYLAKRFSINDETCSKPNIALMSLYYILLAHGICEKEDYFFNLHKNGMVFSFSLYDRIRKTNFEEDKKVVLTHYAEKILNKLIKVLDNYNEDGINYMASTIYMMKWRVPSQLNKEEIFNFINLHTETCLGTVAKQHIFQYVDNNLAL